MDEKQLLEAVRELLDLYRWRWYHTYNSQRSNPGFPDIVAVRGPRLLFIELKGYDAKGRLGTVSAAQEEWLKDLTAAGQSALVIIPDDIPSGRLEYILK